MSWLAILTYLIRLVSSLAKYLDRKQILEAGEARAVSAGMGKSLEELEKVRMARDRLRDPSWRTRLREKYRSKQ